ncbi:MAG: hypothetical protein Q9219_006883 [cf. Caloplaca sp. 3 TL-2023]
MCLCFRPKKPPRSEPVEWNPPLTKLKSDDDDLSSAFHSLSIQNAPIVAKTPLPSIISVPKPSLPTPPTPLPSNITHPRKPQQQQPRGKLPTFPMSRHPKCRRCGWTPKYRSTVKSTNENNNVARSYFICVMCKKDRDANNQPLRTNDNREVGWISWDDYKGVHEDNRPCFCGFVCRQDRAGVDSYCPGMGFWTCATGGCAFLSFRRDALTDREAYERDAEPDEGFRPWLL